jgi:hypothetical protein
MGSMDCWRRGTATLMFKISHIFSDCLTGKKRREEKKQHKQTTRNEAFIIKSSCFAWFRVVNFLKNVKGLTNEELQILRVAKEAEAE